jgi:SWI/SNF-related matrix-associated actin-dependent regulator of chromatin subfamily A member 5
MKPNNYYDFEDEDYREKRREQQRKIIHDNVVKMLDDQVRAGRRDKHKANKSLNEALMFPNLNSSSSGPKKKKIVIQEYKFYADPKRLKELLEKEQEGRFDGKFKLTDEENEEKKNIFDTGFNEWDRKDYFRFIQALEMFATDDHAAIAEHIQTKTADQCEKYAKALFASIDDLTDAVKIQTIVEKTSKLLEFKIRAPELIERKVSAYEDPYEEMVIYPTQKSKFFSKESDVILLCLTHRYNYGNWGKIKRALRQETKCRFDHLLLSRTEKELQRRVDILVKGLEKENQKHAEDKSEGDEDMQAEYDEENESREVEESKEEIIETMPKNKKRRRHQKEEQLQKELAAMKMTTD